MLNEEYDNSPIDCYMYWDQHEMFDVNDWIAEIQESATRLGYWSWVKKKITERATSR